MTRHWRLAPWSPVAWHAACGRILVNESFVMANPEAVTCGNCVKSRAHRLVLLDLALVDQP